MKRRVTSGATVSRTLAPKADLMGTTEKDYGRLRPISPSSLSPQRWCWGDRLADRLRGPQKPERPGQAGRWPLLQSRLLRLPQASETTHLPHSRGGHRGRALVRRGDVCRALGLSMDAGAVRHLGNLIQDEVARWRPTEGITADAPTPSSPSPASTS